MCLLIPYYLHSMWQLHIFCFSTRNWNLCEGKGKISYTNFSCLMICLDTWVFSPIVHVDRNEPLTISICFPAFRNSFPSLPSPDWVGELWIRAPNLPFLLQLCFLKLFFMVFFFFFSCQGNGLGSINNISACFSHNTCLAKIWFISATPWKTNTEHSKSKELD